MSLDTDLLVRLQATQTGANDLGSPSFPLSKVIQHHLTDGTGLNQSNRMFADTRTIAASGSEDLDLTASLTDVFGASLTFARIKTLLIAAAGANTNNVIVGGDTNAFLFGGAAAHTVTVKPGGVFLLTAPDATGLAVTGSTGDILQVANSGAGSSVAYDVVLIGAAS